MVPGRARFVKEAIAILTTAACVIISFLLFKKEAVFSLPGPGFGMDFILRLDHFSSFITLATAAAGFLIALYCSSFLRDKTYARQFYSYLLITLSFVSGAVLSDNLILMLFFWEGLLLTLYAMIAIGSKEAYRSAIKAFIICAVTDLCMMLGIGLTGHLAGTFNISQISLDLAPLASLAFILLVIGAISKAGSMPFHTWIPDAAVDAPLPFMAFLPAAIEKLLGIYFLSRICLDMFDLMPDSVLSTVLMIIGGLTIVFAVMMALIQKDYKRLLSYHAISQVGYMILGIGTALPVGIIGGIFHMLNNAMYKCCLFLTGGAVEKQAGTTDLEKLGGLSAKMPVTFGCFLIAALSISGVPPFNGFFSKELVYDAALERGAIFYLAALLGSFFTAISFLKLGHAAFAGKLNKEHESVKELGWAMLAPMVIIALLCVAFGVFNAWPINSLIQPILGDRAAGHVFSGFPDNFALVLFTLLVLAAAIISHILGTKATGSGVKAVDYIHYAPVLSKVYSLAERKFFDPYEVGMKLLGVLSRIIYMLDRLIDWVYEKLALRLALGLSQQVRSFHNGNYTLYIAWSLTGMFLVIIFLMARG
jgi:NADH-quinone oxidoreductase subunit L